MVSCVILAGYNARELRAYKKALRSGYPGEDIIPSYKALLSFSSAQGKTTLLQSTIDITSTLEQQNVLDDVVIVGPEQRLLPHVQHWLSNKHVLVDQNASLENLAEEFSLQLDTNSLCGNAIKGYARTRAYAKREPALFLASDSPFTSPDGISAFLLKAKDAALVLPIVKMQGKRDACNRRYFYLNTLEGIRGFRLSSYLLANPHQLDISVIEKVYSLRKILSWQVQKRFFSALLKTDILGGLWLLAKYAVYQLHKEDCEDYLSRALKGKCLLLPTDDVYSTYDVDTNKDVSHLQHIMENYIKQPPLTSTR
ncbi:MAG: hypothetical protein V1725_07580 [archaeon]